MSKNTDCPICNKKLGFLKHEFEQGIRICNKCFTQSNITFTELTQRDQRKITIDEIKERVQIKEKEDCCAICDKKLNLFTKTKLADANICGDCMVKSKVKVMKLETTRLSEIKHIVDGKITDISPTKKIGEKVHFNDDTNKILVIPAEIINYNDVTSFELIEDGDAIASGGIGRAVVGGALFGGAGAIVGSMTSKKKCSNLQIKLTVKNSSESAVYITFINEEVKKNSEKYTSAFKQAQECLSTLEIISNEQEKQGNVSNNSVADEILKFKELLDIGAISEEEYNVKKSELLDI